MEALHSLAPCGEGPEGIQAYLVERAGPRITRKVMRDVRSAIQFIATRPMAGHFREDLADPPVRFWPIYSYLVIYDSSANPVQILRVLHGARDVAALLP